MKKLITGVIAAAALLFGFASCSGDLHDTSEISLAGGACPGAMNSWSNTTSWTTENGNVYTYEFSATSTEAEWKCIAVAGDWNSGAFGGGENKETETPVGKTTALTYDNATGGYKNAKITGMDIGSTYRITVTVDVLEASAKIDCIKAVPKFYIVIGDETKEMDIVTGGYNYLINADKAGSISFYINGSNMAYYSAESALTTGEAETVSPSYSIPTTNTTFAYEKGEYLINVDTSAGYDKVKITAKYAAILKSSLWAINGPMGITQINPTAEDDSTYTVEFTATKGGWGASGNDMCFAVYGQLTLAALTDNANWWDKTTYRFGGFDAKVGEQVTCESKGDNITLKNIEDGATYIATFTSDANNVYMTVAKKE